MLVFDFAVDPLLQVIQVLREHFAPLAEQSC
jgi:hypothetical protein